ncbi:MAG: Transketolase [uncultured Quadrisphaera sp.]|uniref:Transketolase n=1 Tax=uncultured Quadrisphaera sp. TaxID=904978 RepID=A0A6J4NU65_9ACTN|nr:MAG: Transketolase [uncultured Quadrisphaera sp.]
MADPATLTWDETDQRAVDTARLLAADAVQKVGNGHPGTAMSLAPLAYLLFQKVMAGDPADDQWPGRDRFVLSAGHSSLTLYTQLYLAGYGLELDDLKALRTWGSKTPGHPEYKHTRGVEITTGPLGQGLATAVGMAAAARRERGLLDPDAEAGTSVFDHTVFVVASDGDLQEGITAEASSWAGHQELGNLVVVYDQNQISIEDDTDISFTEDVVARYASYGWHTQTVDWRGGRAADGAEAYAEDLEALHAALQAAKAERGRPSFIALKTIIAWPAPTLQNTGKAHGAALGEDEVRATKEVLGFDPDATFAVDDAVLARTRGLADRVKPVRADWDSRYADWAAANPERAALHERLSTRTLPDGWQDALPTFEAGKDVSTRKASGAVLNALGPVLPELWGGSADLAESNNTTIEGDSFVPSTKTTAMWPGGPYGRTLHFGIREHAMGAILSGITLHGGTRAYGGTFLVFSDYMRPAVRLAALMEIPTTYVWTHDSIGLGEDGPTHQPVEHLAALRTIPGLAVVRPADANETALAWRGILERTDGPAGLVLTRQNVPTYERGPGEATPEAMGSADGVLKGAYVLAEASGGAPQVILVGTGSEVQIAVAAREQLEADGVPTRVVSMPCREWFVEQDPAYLEQVLPGSVRARVSVEAGVSAGWRDVIGDAGRSVSLEHFGASADYKTLYAEFGFTAEAVVAAARESMAAVGADTLPPLAGSSPTEGGAADR